MAGRAGHRGFGHIRKLPSGRYQASYIGPDLARHTAPTTYQDKDAAVLWLRNERIQVESDDWNPPKQRAQLKRRDSFASYADAWLPRRRVRGQPLRARTKAHYRNLLDAKIIPTFGTIAVRNITAESVSVWHSSLDESTPTLNAHAYSLLKAILGTAVDEEIIATNPCRIKGAGQARRVSTTEPATLEELAIIVAKIPQRFRLMVLLASWCALRFGELTELRRSDFTKQCTVVRVHRAVAWAKGEQVIGQPKSDAGIREVAIPPHLIPFVCEHLKTLPMTGRNTLLFPSATDPTKPMRQSTMQRAFYPARAAAGRTDLRFHDLRHTGAVLAAATGATLAELMARLGHSTPAAAMKYQHAAKGRDAEIAALLSKLSEMRNE